MHEDDNSIDAGIYREGDLPYLTAKLPPAGGVIKQRPADFMVTEISLYPPCGEGTHVYVTIEKEGITTDQAVRRVAKALRKQPRDIGYAGLKDAQAVTRQTLSVEHVDPDAVARVSIDGLRVLSVGLHTNKLRIGHLAGNRFAIKLRDVSDNAVDGVSGVLEILRRRGVPNYFGPQRFGRRGTNGAVGLAVLRGDFETALHWILDEPQADERGEVDGAKELAREREFAEACKRWPHWCKAQIRVCSALARGADSKRAWMTVDHAMRRLYVSAAQGCVFNRVLARRITEFDRVMTGDLAMLHQNGACFSVDDVAAEQPRCDRFEISPTGPIVGKRMTQPTGIPESIEQGVMQELGLSGTEVRYRDKFRIDGARRPLRVPISDSSCHGGEDEHGPYVELKFTLPPGSYATAVVREICKW